MLQKRGQVEVVAVIIGIAVLSLMYVIFVPLTEKCKIIPTLPECSSVSVQKGIIFEEQPGFLRQQLDHASYSLKPAELFTKEEVDIATMLQDAMTERTIFTSTVQRGKFRLYGQGKEIKLFINVKESKGALKVRINGNQVAVVKGDGTNVVEVSPSNLKQENILELESSTPLLPWDTNYYSLDSVVIKQVYSIFKVSQTEIIAIEENLSDISSATLSFWSDCISNENLVVMINNIKILDEYTCRYNSLDVKLLKSNTFVFKSNGDYYVHDVHLDLKFKANDYPTYHFDISQENYDAISSGKKSSLLSIEFDSTELKKFDLYLNNNIVTRADTTKLIWQADIDRLLRKGQNSIKLVPRTDINILNLKLEI